MKRRFFRAQFILTDAISITFQWWMEEDHFKKMHQSGCFEDGIQKFLDYESQPGFKTVTYIHYFKSEEEERKYKNDFRPPLRIEFSDKWKENMERKEIIPDLSFGREEEI